MGKNLPPQLTQAEVEIIKSDILGLEDVWSRLFANRIDNAKREIAFIYARRACELGLDLATYEKRDETELERLRDKLETYELELAQADRRAAEQEHIIEAQRARIQLREIDAATEADREIDDRLADALQEELERGTQPPSGRVNGTGGHVRVRGAGFDLTDNVRKFLEDDCARVLTDVTRDGVPHRSVVEAALRAVIDENHTGFALVEFDFDAVNEKRDPLIWVRRSR